MERFSNAPSVEDRVHVLWWHSHTNFGVVGPARRGTVSPFLHPRRITTEHSQIRLKVHHIHLADHTRRSRTRRRAARPTPTPTSAPAPARSARQPRHAKRRSPRRRSLPLGQPLFHSRTILTRETTLLPQCPTSYSVGIGATSERRGTSMQWEVDALW